MKHKNFEKRKHINDRSVKLLAKMSIIIFWLLILMSFVSLSSGLTYLNYFEKLFDLEICNSNWVINDIEGLRSDLKNKVFGQPFLEKVLVSSLKIFLENDNPSKPFVVSFNGSPGTGKTMVSQLIAANMYYKGTKSQFYRHYTMVDTHFVSQRELVNDIKTRAKKCGRSLFVFDEIEKMPNGTFDAIKPFLDFHHEVSGIDFRKNIFIFISNNGMNKINSITKDLWYKGVKRGDIKLSSFDQSLFKSALNEEGGLKGTGIVKNYLVDMYLPFLPLEKEHVVQCIKAAQYDITFDNFNNVVDDLVFEPKDAPLFSLSGCKLVESLIRKYQGHDEL
ncbi:unnamed protein product [Nezara viridula]|uniref:AAA+ ATPase domain-containing protein n=1 Tax=Nezara viridula TaxID=85310 RepID=A0A9P0HI11_NEZVI|nr:unnamed protein product [Nezara viridula]